MKIQIFDYQLICQLLCQKILKNVTIFQSSSCFQSPALSDYKLHNIIFISNLLIQINLLDKSLCN